VLAVLAAVLGEAIGVFALAAFVFAGFGSDELLHAARKIDADKIWIKAKLRKILINLSKEKRRNA
jgi:hypothetical protein